ncbi:MAG: AAA family ATPase [Candidatus Thorarchaeota archaeon]
MSIRRNVRIKDAYKVDEGRGKIRIDPSIIKEQKFKTGDVIEISNPRNSKKTAALLYPGKPEDKGSDSIRIDSSLRRNLNVSLDDIVAIRKIEAEIATRIVFAGIEESVIIRRSEQLVRMLENRVITEGDIISFNAMGRKIDFIVTDFSPKADAVRIHLSTEIRIAEKTHKELLQLENRRVTFDDIGGMDTEIQSIRDIIELPLKHPELFETMGIEPLSGILLHGPSGTGKTLLARAVACESEAHFISVNSSELLSKYYGQSEEYLRKIFEEARDMAPSIIYIDQVDIIAPTRNEFISEREKGVIAQLLTLLDGLEPRSRVIVIAETSRIDDIDDAFRQSGRFDREIEFKVPDMEGRYEILKVITRGVPLSEDVDLEIIASKTTGFVGASLRALVKEAALLPMKEIIPELEYDKPIPSEILNTLQISMEHFLTALENMKPNKSK